MLRLLLCNGNCLTMFLKKKKKKKKIKKVARVNHVSHLLAQYTSYVVEHRQVRTYAKVEEIKLLSSFPFKIGYD